MFNTYSSEKQWLKNISCMLFIGMMALSSNAKADSCINSIKNCLVDSCKLAVNVVEVVGEVLKFGVSYPQCVAAIAAQDYASIASMTTISGLAATGVVGSSYDSCTADLYGNKAKIFIDPLVAIVPSDTLKQIADGTFKGGVKEALNAVPFPMSTTLPTLGLQLDCGCAVAGAGAGVIEKIKKSIGTAKSAVKNCGNVLSCIGGPVYDAIAGVGHAFAETGKCVYTPNDCGETEGMPPPDYYKIFWQPFINQYVDAALENSYWAVPDYGGSYKKYTPESFVNETWHDCEDYYKNHKTSGDNSRKVCDFMRDNQFLPTTRSLIDFHVETEMFPKKVNPLKYDAITSYLEACALPSNTKPKVGNGIQIDTDGGANTYGGFAKDTRDDCIKNTNTKFGDVNAPPNDDTVVGYTKKTYRNYPLNNIYDFDKAFKAALAKFDADLKQTGESFKKNIAQNSEENIPTATLNKVYRDITLIEKWPEYKAKCPGKNAVGYKECLQKTADYLGIKISDGLKHSNDLKDPAFAEFADIDFYQWSTQPDIYKLSLASYKNAAKNGPVTESLARGLILIAYLGKQAELNAIPTQAIKEAYITLAKQRQQQEIVYQDKLDSYTRLYTQAIECHLPLSDQAYSSCEYSKPTLDAMFAEWSKKYQYFISKKAVLDQIVTPNIPYPDGMMGGIEYLLAEIDSAKISSKALYDNLKKQPGAFIKTARVLSFLDPKISADSLKNSKIPEKQLVKDTFGNPTDPIRDVTGSKTAEELLSADKLRNGAIGGGKGELEIEAAPTKRRGMPGAVTMIMIGGDKTAKDKLIANDKLLAGINAGNKAADNNDATKKLSGIDTKNLQIDTKNINSGITNGAALKAATAGNENRVQQSVKSLEVTGPETTAPAPKKEPLKIIITTLKVEQPPFNRALYERDTKNALTQKWLNNCKVDGCKSVVTVLIDKRIKDAFIALDSGKDLRDTNILNTIETALNKKYDPQMQTQIDLKPTPARFDIDQYRAQAKATQTNRWIPKCRNNNICILQVNRLIGERVYYGFDQLVSRQNLNDKNVISAIEKRLDLQYDALMQDQVDHPHYTKD